MLTLWYTQLYADIKHEDKNMALSKTKKRVLYWARRGRNRFCSTVEICKGYKKGGRARQAVEGLVKDGYAVEIDREAWTETYQGRDKHYHNLTIELTEAGIALAREEGEA